MNDRQSCIELCQKCHDTCLETLVGHCLPMGGKHVEQTHVRLMLDCIDICRTSADFMHRSSPMHTLTCAACAEICEACAKSCDAVGDMDACARSEEHTSELQSLMRISSAVLCLKKKTTDTPYMK